MDNIKESWIPIFEKSNVSEILKKNNIPKIRIRRI